MSEAVIFGGGGRLDREFLLKRAVNTLATVDVNANAGAVSPLAEFEERRKAGSGRYLTQEVFEKAEGGRLSDVLVSTLAGVRGYSIGSQQSALASARGVPSINKMPAGDAIDRARGAGAHCYLQVIVDRIIRYKGDGSGESLFDVNSIPIEEIAAIEYYTVSQTPSALKGVGSPCGTVVIWTKAR